MIELTEHDYAPLETFRLVWRLTDARWNLLPPNVLAGIRPLNEAKAKEICERLCVIPRPAFLPPHYELIDEIDTSDEDIHQVRDWLRKRIPDRKQSIVISWDYSNAVVTTGDVFLSYWDDFCYPASDDVDVFPLTEDWVLVYWHEEVFFFGQRNTK